MVVPSPPFFPGPRPEMEPLSKDSLRRAALEARKAFVRTLSDGDRALLENRLAEHLTSLFAGVAVVGGYCPLGSEISPLPATEEARSVGAIVAYPSYSNPAKPFRFLAGDPLEPGPFGMMQPARRHPVVQPDLVLVPLIAVDGHGSRLGRGKGHYDRALVSLKKNGARLIGVGWKIQRLTETIPHDEWDIPLDAFASPDGLEVFDSHRL
ncbi:MAG TPA: 5-formyltetrahydrofolate cyclo-ligase [Sphingomicrobium sp.]|nr:5-formyltetrahydrofolate cyclo-ligase [Sphingomicrobium sp.]